MLLTTGPSSFWKQLNTSILRLPKPHKLNMSFWGIIKKISSPFYLDSMWILWRQFGSEQCWRSISLILIMKALIMIPRHATYLLCLGRAKLHEDMQLNKKIPPKGHKISARFHCILKRLEKLKHPSVVVHLQICCTFIHAAWVWQSFYWQFFFLCILINLSKVTILINSRQSIFSSNFIPFFVLNCAHQDSRRLWGHLI